MRSTPASCCSYGAVFRRKRKNAVRVIHLTLTLSSKEREGRSMGSPTAIWTRVDRRLRGAIPEHRSADRIFDGAQRACHISKELTRRHLRHPIVTTPRSARRCERRK
jgi:hypothetical protein